MGAKLNNAPLLGPQGLPPRVASLFGCEPLAHLLLARVADPDDLDQNGLAAHMAAVQRGGNIGAIGIAPSAPMGKMSR